MVTSRITRDRVVTKQHARITNERVYQWQDLPRILIQQISHAATCKNAVQNDYGFVEVNRVPWCFFGNGVHPKYSQISADSITEMLRIQSCLTIGTQSVSIKTGRTGLDGMLDAKLARLLGIPYIPNNLFRSEALHAVYPNAKAWHILVIMTKRGQEPPKVWKVFVTGIPDESNSTTE